MPAADVDFFPLYFYHCISTIINFCTENFPRNLELCLLFFPSERSETIQYAYFTFFEWKFKSMIYVCSFKKSNFFYTDE